MNGSREQQDPSQMEIYEWNNVNKALRHHGFKVIDVKRAVESSECRILLDNETSTRLRETLTSLMRDCDRRQDLIQELITTNNQLKNDFRIQLTASEKLESTANDMKLMLDTTKLRIQDLEEESEANRSHRSYDNDGSGDTGAIRSRCQHLQQKCFNYEEELERLRKKLEKISHEDSLRKAKQNEVMQQLKRRSARGSMGEQILTLIDSYERQIFKLKRQSELGKTDADALLRKTDGDTSVDPSPANRTLSSIASVGDTNGPDVKSIIKIYEKQLRDYKKKTQSLENDKALLALELQTRPELKDYRDAVMKAKQLERMVKGLDSGRDKNYERPSLHHVNTNLDDIERLSISVCRQYLQDICRELEVSDLNQVIPKVIKCREKELAIPHLEQILEDVLRVIGGRDLPRPPDYGNRKVPPSTSDHEIWCEKTWCHVTPTLEYWADQLRALRELQDSVNRLRLLILPSKTSPLMGEPDAGKILETIDSLANLNHSELRRRHGGAIVGSERPPKDLLAGIVEHFMTLFDLNSVLGCYPRMNDIYAKLGEVANVMHTLRNLLDLDANASSCAVVDKVAQLLGKDGDQDKVEEGTRRSLNMDDTNSVVLRLQQHRDFFPAFEQSMATLMKLLDVQEIDKVVPAVYALKFRLGRQRLDDYN